MKKKKNFPRRERIVTNDESRSRASFGRCSQGSFFTLARMEGLHILEILYATGMNGCRLSYSRRCTHERCEKNYSASYAREILSCNFPARKFPTCYCIRIINDPEVHNYRFSIVQLSVTKPCTSSQLKHVFRRWTSEESLSEKTCTSRKVRPLCLVLSPIIQHSRQRNPVANTESETGKAREKKRLSSSKGRYWTLRIFQCRLNEESDSKLRFQSLSRIQCQNFLRVRIICQDG